MGKNLRLNGHILILQEQWRWGDILGVTGVVPDV